MKKLGIIIAILLHVIVGFAQRSVTVGAKIETDFQIWYLDSIVLSNDSTTLKWHVESKGNTYACMSLLRKRLRIYTLHNSKKAVTAD